MDGRAGERGLSHPAARRNSNCTTRLRDRGGYAFTKLMFLVSLGFVIARNPGRLYFLAIAMSVILAAFVIYGLLARWVFPSTPATRGSGHAPAQQPSPG